MPTYAAVLEPSSNEDLNGTVGAAAASAEIIIGLGRIFALNATGDLSIKFGNSGMAAPTAANYRIPSGVTAEYDMGKSQDRIRLFNNGASTVTYWIQYLNK